MLSQDLRSFLADLTVFRGGWTLEAARSVCDNPASARIMSQLRERSLIETMECPDAEVGLRFRMTEAMREYVDTQTDAEERFSLQRRHAEFYADLVRRSRGKLKGAEQTDWLLTIEAEFENIRCAVAWALDHAKETALEMAVILTAFWKIRGQVAEGRNWISRALAACPHGDPGILGAAFTAAGDLATIAPGDLTEAHSFYEQGLSIHRANNNLKGVSAALNNLGILARNRNNYAQAKAYYEESLRIDEEMKDWWGVAASLNNLGNMATSTHDFKGACAMHERALSIRRELGDRRSVAWSLYNLGNVHRHLDRTPAARSFFVESLQITRELGDKTGILLGVLGLTILSCRTGDYHAARDDRC